MQVTQAPDIPLELSPVLLKDIQDAIAFAISAERKGVKPAAKPRLAQFHAYSLLRKSSPKMAFTFTDTLLRDILDCIAVANARSEMDKSSQVRLNEFEILVKPMLPEIVKPKQTRLKL